MKWVERVGAEHAVVAVDIVARGHHWLLAKGPEDVMLSPTISCLSLRYVRSHAHGACCARVLCLPRSATWSGSRPILTSVSMVPTLTAIGELELHAAGQRGCVVRPTV